MKEKYMLIALKEAEKAFKEDEVPIGCVIVLNDKIVAKGHNKKEKKNCSVFHAEIETIRKATRKLETWHLDDCEMYITLEPCIMCAGAIINSRIKKVYYAASDPKGGAFESNLKIKEIKGLNHYPEYESGILKEQSAALLKEFFKNKRKSITKEI